MKEEFHRYVFENLEHNPELSRQAEPGNEPLGFEGVKDQRFPVRHAVEAGLARLDTVNFSRRLKALDSTLWPGRDDGRGTGIGGLGWIEAPTRAAEALKGWRAEAERLVANNPRRIYLLGMGGSSVFPGALSSLYAPNRTNGRALVLVDNFFPATLSPLLEQFAQPDSLVVVASKSGTTLETLAMASVAEAVGAAPRMVAITDPGTELEQRARELGYGAVVHGFSDVGGRFSALTAFGLFPGLLLGDPVEDVVDSAVRMALLCNTAVDGASNPGAVLGAAVAAAWSAGCELFDVFTARGAGAFNGWIEQLLSESLGKENQGVWPRARRDDSLRPNAVADDGAGIFVPNWPSSTENTTITWKMEESGAAWELGAEVYRWEVATVAAAVLMNVPPFNEPDVVGSKKITREASQDLAQGKGLVWPAEVVRDGSWSLARCVEQGAGAAASLQEFFHRAKATKSALTFLVFAPPVAASSSVAAGLIEKIEARCGVPVFSAFGPQYLHATGQLYKGGSDRAAHLILTCDDVEDTNIPRYDGVELGALALAQGLADVEALVGRNRTVLHLHFHGTHSDALAQFDALVAP